MESTKLVYMEDMHTLEGNAKVLEVGEQDSRKYVVLDQTILYAQGGGQPADYGVIKCESGEFVVSDVRFREGIVYHYGEYRESNIFTPLERRRTGEGSLFSVGDGVTIQVDAERRQLHKRLHSGAHILDMAVAEMGLPWVPGKGYHFPDGPYVEYSGSLEEMSTEVLKTKLEDRCNQIIASDLLTSTRFVSVDEMAKLCRFVPHNLPTGKPTRVVMYGSFGVPCGGTHVAHLAEVGREVIRKIKVDKGIIKVGYTVDI